MYIVVQQKKPLPISAVIFSYLRRLRYDFLLWTVEVIILEGYNLISLALLVCL